MPPWLVPLLLQLLSEAPTLVADGENLFHSVANGEGGVQKVANVVANLNTLATHGSQALAGVAAQVQPAPVTPPPAA